MHGQAAAEGAVVGRVGCWEEEADGAEDAVALVLSLFLLLLFCFFLSFSVDDDGVRFCCDALR